MNKHSIPLVIVLLLLAAIISPKVGFSAPYYEGKVITLVVGFAPGGGYDRIARLLSKSLPKYIPGKPSIVVQNMPGGAGLLCANHLYNVPKPDGLTLATFERGLILAQLTKVEGVRFDFNQFSWIGSAGIIPIIFVIRSDLPYKSFDELNRSKDQIFAGATEVGGITTQFPMLLKEFAKVNLKIVPGYPATSDIMLALERKEVDGFAASYSTILPLIKRGVVRPIIRGRVSIPEIEKLPVNEDLTSDSKGKTLMSMLSSIDQLGRPFASPPGTPLHIVETLRDAFTKALSDPELIDLAQKSKLETDYINPQVLSKAISFVLKQPKDVVDEFTRYVKF
jgi:tripartite-type tricarboxylate transporter receptor subunit TctC